VAEDGSARGWSFLVVDEGDRQHRGNEGYDDEPSRYYSWDSTVANHRGPHPGDLCLVRDSRGVLGISQIDAIDRTDGAEKIRQRCPKCGSTALKQRKTVAPAYRCSNCKAEFDQPDEEPIEITRYRADYVRSWLAIEGAVKAEDLEASCYLSRSKQHAIRLVDLSALSRLLASRQVLVGRDWWRGGGVIELPEIPAGRRRRTVFGRIGQHEFRRRLLERFGPVCAFTGPQPPDSLHAAHVTPYATDPRHELAGGLLLRADLHSLFDLHLITIDSDLLVRIDPSLRKYRELSRLDGATLRINLADPLLPTLRALLGQRKSSD
jgi:DNA-directed RNA polymerase subunit RPC12/RpoP